MIAFFVESVQEAPGIFTFRFRPEKKLDYTAGQFVGMTIPHKADERGDKRWFTLSSSPTEEPVSITTRIAMRNGSSFKHELQKLRPGDTVSISDPMGDFVLPIDSGVPITFIAGGIGITPVRSMVKWLLDTGEKRPAELIYFVREPTDAVFGDIFKAYGLPTHVIPTHPGEGVSAPKILELNPDNRTKLFYLSGPEPMVEKLVADLEGAGIEKSRLVTDYFLNYPSF